MLLTLARDETVKPDSYDQYLVKMLKELIAKEVPVKVCGACMARCGIHKGKPYHEGAQKAIMNDLAKWIVNSDKVLTFYKGGIPPLSKLQVFQIIFKERL